MNKRQSGITLIELMIVVAIVGILAAIAYPSYRAYVLRSNRTDAKIALEQTAQALEKCFTRYMAYDSDNCTAAKQLDDGGSFETSHGFYKVTGKIENATFTLTATAQAGQVSDKECMNFSVKETGAKSVSGTGSTDRCW